MVSKKQTQLLRRRMKRFGRRVRRFLMPSADNHYRPYLVRRIPLVIVVVAAVVLQFGYNYMHTGDVLGRSSQVTAEDLLSETNIQRSDNLVGHLRYSSVLEKAAHDKAQDMLQKDYWSHVAPDGTEPWVWLKEEGYAYTVAGENLAKNFLTSKAVISAWMASESHRENMLNATYKDVGFAVVDGELEGESTSLVVAFYAAPASKKVVGSTSNVSAHSEEAIKSPAHVQLSLADKTGVMLQSLSPAGLTSLVLLLVAGTVAVTAHFYRGRLPQNRRESWHRHHGWLKAFALIGIAALCMVFYSGGQI